MPQFLIFYIFFFAVIYCSWTWSLNNFCIVELLPPSNVSVFVFFFVSLKNYSSKFSVKKSKESTGRVVTWRELVSSRHTRSLTKLLYDCPFSSVIKFAQLLNIRFFYYFCWFVWWIRPFLISIITVVIVTIIIDINITVIQLYSKLVEFCFSSSTVHVSSNDPIRSQILPQNIINAFTMESTFCGSTMGKLKKKQFRCCSFSITISSCMQIFHWNFLIFVGAVTVIMCSNVSIVLYLNLRFIHHQHLFGEHFRWIHEPTVF